MGSNLSTVSIAIPVYNNSKTILELLEHLEKVAQTLEETISVKVEVVAVDDRSTDSSLLLLQAYEASRFSLIVGAQRRNAGQPATILHAWSLVSGECVVTMSADLQDPPDKIVTFVESYLAGADVVIGRRVSREDSHIFEIGSIVATRLLSRDLSIQIDRWFDFFAMGSHVKDSVLSLRGYRRFLQAEVLQASSQISFVDYERRASETPSGNTLKKRWRIFADSFIAVSSLPLRFLTLSSVGVSLLALIWSIALLIAYVTGKSNPDGWIPIMLSILLTSSLVLISLGFILSYVARIHEIVRNVPGYFVSSQTGQSVHTQKPNDESPKGR